MFGSVSESSLICHEHTTVLHKRCVRKFSLELFSFLDLKKSTNSWYILGFLTHQADLFHRVPPGFVHSSKATSLLGHLGHDVWGTEDRLKVEPCALNLQPLIHNFLQQKQLTLPFPEIQTHSYSMNICNLTSNLVHRGFKGNVNITKIA